MKTASVLFVIFSSLAAFAGPGNIVVGDTGPAVAITQIHPDGSEAKESIYAPHGKTRFTMIEFSSITCGYCEMNVGPFNKLAQEISATTTSRIIEVDRDEAAVRQYVASHKADMKVPVGLDLNRDADHAYGIEGTPTTYVLDSNNKVIYIHLGGPFEDADIAAIKALVK